MRSIRDKFVILSLLIILSSAAIFTSINIWNISREETYAATQVINAACREAAADLNRQLGNITSSVGIVEGIAGQDAHSRAWLSDVKNRESFLMTMRTLLRGVAENTPEISSYYLRLSPEIAADSAGFLFHRENDQTPFTGSNLTDILAYDEEDTDYVGWYYLPKNAGHAIWMEPYHNRTLKQYVISYVMPLYVSNDFLGVMGIDIDFRSFIRPVKELSVYQTGYAYLMDSEGKLFYHPSLPAGTELKDTKNTLDRVLDRFQAKNNGNQLIGYSYDGSARKMAFSALENGMNLVVTASSRAIYSRRFSLLMITIGLAILVSLLWGIVTITVTRRTVRPLLALTSAVNQVAKGNLEAELPQATNDEVGELTRDFQVMRQYLRTYISDINGLAYRDPLTGVKNKAAYEALCQQQGRNMQAGRNDFAVVMMDANGLKGINDQYGHAVGDEFLRNVSRMICRVYKHSPVFRLGGDEFVVFLQGEDYKIRNELLEELRREMEQSASLPAPEQRISMAVGMSTSRATDTSIDQALARADERMYADKKEIKAARRKGEGK